MRSFLVGLVSVVALAGVARADFVVKDVPSEVAPVVASAQDVTADRNGAYASEAVPSAPRFKIAYGFGNRVRLSFACRQIVPQAVHVSYGPGVQPDALVDWKGGDGWNRVLLGAVKPLGLHLVTSTMAVEIRR